MICVDAFFHGKFCSLTLNCNFQTVIYSRRFAHSADPDCFLEAWRVGGSDACKTRRFKASAVMERPLSKIGVAKSMPGGFKIDPCRLQNRPSEATKSRPNCSGMSKISPRACQERPRASEERPRASQESPRASQERPKSAPRAPQERPKSAQERCKSVQERPKSHSRAPRDAPERPWGTILRLRSSKEAAFEGDPSRDSVEKRVRNDFRSMLASCAPTQTC